MGTPRKSSSRLLQENYGFLGPPCVKTSKTTDDGVNGVNFAHTMFSEIWRNLNTIRKMYRAEVTFPATLASSTIKIAEEEESQQAPSQSRSQILMFLKIIPAL